MDSLKGQCVGIQSEEMNRLGSSQGKAQHQLQLILCLFPRYPSGPVLSTADVLGVDAAVLNAGALLYQVRALPSTVLSMLCWAKDHSERCCRVKRRCPCTKCRPLKERSEASVQDSQHETASRLASPRDLNTRLAQSNAVLSQELH